MPSFQPLPADAGQQIIALLVDMRAAVDEIRARLEGSCKPLLTIEEVAQLTGRAPYTVRRWVKEGQLNATRVAGAGPRGRLLVPREQVQRLVGLGRGGSIPAELLNASVKICPVETGQATPSQAIG
jgi:excisionase family DNA binding protein